MHFKTTTTVSRSKPTKSTASTHRRSRARFDDDEHPAPEENNEEWCSYINKYDVCITTYNILTNDLHVARLPTRRPRRDGASYVNIPRQRSPLVTCEWYWVIMDEVQMVGGW
jgi:E3 ubiquitin-protein ligase SHPRH